MTQNPRRKAVVTTSAALRQQPSRSSVFKALKGKAHVHACTNRDCRLTYEDNCANPELNGRCANCRGLCRPLWETARDPADCCPGNTSMVLGGDDHVRYALAGPGPWFQCQKCFRCHSHPVMKGQP